MLVAPKLTLIYERWVSSSSLFFCLKTEYITRPALSRNMWFCCMKWYTVAQGGTKAYTFCIHFAYKKWQSGRRLTSICVTHSTEVPFYFNSNFCALQPTKLRCHSQVITQNTNKSCVILNLVFTRLWEQFTHYTEVGVIVSPTSAHLCVRAGARLRCLTPSTRMLPFGSTRVSVVKIKLAQMSQTRVPKFSPVFTRV